MFLRKAIRLDLIRYFTFLRFSRNLSQVAGLFLSFPLFQSEFFCRIAWVTSLSIHGGVMNLRGLRFGMKAFSLEKSCVFHDVQLCSTSLSVSK